MTRKETINLVNICFFVFGILFMSLPNPEQITFLSIGFFVTSILNFIFNNILNNENN